MKKYYKMLNDVDRNCIKESKDKLCQYAEKYGLTFETVREQCSKLLLECQVFGNEDEFWKTFEQMLDKSKSLADKRIRSRSWLTIYNGIVTQGLLARRSFETAKDKVYLTDCDDVLCSMRWHDILILSAIYNILDRPQGIKASPKIEVITQSIWRQIMPNVDYSDDFKDIVIDTVSKFRMLSGSVVTQISEDKSESNIIHESYFLDSSTDEDGDMRLSIAQDYKSQCDVLGRLVRIDRSLLSSKTLEEQVLRTYILWRKSTGSNEHSKMGSIIRIDTMQYQTGIDLVENWKMLKAVCRSLKVNIDSSRIWWDNK